MSYWPALLSKSLVFPEISLVLGGEVTETKEVKNTIAANFDFTDLTTQLAKDVKTSIKEVLRAQEQQGAVPVYKIALARSGDKGNMVNIGVMARSQKAYEFLDKNLTAQVIKDMFQELCHGPVVRYSLPNLGGFNFLLESALGGGGTKSLRIDPQGKTFAQALLNQKISIPKDVLDSLAN
jgi:hypothetical protein